MNNIAYYDYDMLVGLVDRFHQSIGLLSAKETYNLDQAIKNRIEKAYHNQCLTKSEYLGLLEKGRYKKHPQT